MHQVAQIGLAHDLALRTEKNGSIQVGIMGAGEMGTDLITQCSLMQGIRVVAVSAKRSCNVRKAALIAYGDESIVREARNQSDLLSHIEMKKIAITSNELLVTNPLIDVVIDATGAPAVAADFIPMAMEHGKHIVSMNVEADVTIGAYLKYYADRCGVIYTLGAGDEPVSCMELIEFVTALGYEIVSAGKGKNNRLDYNVVPDDCREEALRRNMNPRILSEFIDGSKTMAEMAALSNATGLVPDVAGMHGPLADRDNIHKILIAREDGGILSRKGVVDYTIGKDVAPGVFVIARASHPRIIERMDDLKIGKGPYYSFFRPYHLTSLEVPLTVARVMLYKKADMAPLLRPVSEVCAIAKRDIKEGETLDAIGETCYRSWIMKASEAKEVHAFPAGILFGAKAIGPIKKGEIITQDNAAPDASTRLYALRQMQEKLFYRQEAFLS